MASQVAVIGAGPCGLAQLGAFEEARRQGAEVPEVTCFEQQSDWGGLWNYTWRTGLDEHGDPVHGSKYRYLWSNGPKECLEFADYTFDEHFGQPIPSFPPREVLCDYITGRAKANNVRRFIQFDTAVRWISYDEKTGKFAVTVQARDDGQTRTEEFDKVIVATGHFSTPNMPSFEGFDQFPGRIMHSHDFRDAQEFAGKRLLVIGSSYSAEDIALQTKKYGAQSVTVSYRTAPMGFPWRRASMRCRCCRRSTAAPRTSPTARHAMWTPSCCAPGTSTRSGSSPTRCGCAPRTCCTRPPVQGHLLARPPRPHVPGDAGPVLHVHHVRRAGMVRAGLRARPDPAALARGNGRRHRGLARQAGRVRGAARRDRLPGRLRGGPE